jgi:GGDEF domain-containing protein
VGKFLVAFDTDHIKQYVFGTDRLREIRGASSILDYLNRIVMTGNEKDAPEPLPYAPITVCANGGGGIFVVESDDPNGGEAFGKYMQRRFRALTGDGASVTYAVQPLPDNIKVTEGRNDESLLVNDPATEPYVKTLRWRLREKKLIQDSIINPTNPFMRPCNSCGIFYAVPKIPELKEFLEEFDIVLDEEEDLDNSENLYCESCQRKHLRDLQVKLKIRYLVLQQNNQVKEFGGDYLWERIKEFEDDYLWERIIEGLGKKSYDFKQNPGRPRDFNVFADFKGKKDYFALIYADANGMGKAFDNCNMLKTYHALAQTVDGAIYQAVCAAIAEHLKIEDHVPADQRPTTFPFDILLMGGDDVLMVVPATAALDVALTISKEFQRIMSDAYPDDLEKRATLSVGVVIAPIKYPFRLLEKLADTTLKAAKDQAKGKDDPRINFVTVAGSTGESFAKVYDLLHTPSRIHDHPVEKQFFATLRPYTPETMATLLKEIRKGRKKNLGRTKLHQMREAIMKMNLTTSVSDSRAVLVNWKPDQRDFVVEYVHTLANQYLIEKTASKNLESLRYDRPFPWFFSEKKGKRNEKNEDGRDIYRTPLLDFIELYDFVSGEEGADGDTH